MNEKKFKLFHKPEKGRMGGLLIVFAWIIVWNIIYQALHSKGLTHIGSLEIINWSFFLSVTIFFMQEELTYAQRFWHTLVGGIVGLLLAAGIVLGCTVLMKNGLSYLPSISIMLAVSIGVLILAAPYIPMVFNNVGFCYLIISLIDSTKTIEQLPSNILSLALGSIILNLGCCLLLDIYKKALTKKLTAAAMAAAAKSEAEAKN